MGAMVQAPQDQSQKRESQGKKQRHSLTQSILGECPCVPGTVLALGTKQ